jgi:hypothetical protein
LQRISYDRMLDEGIEYENRLAYQRRLEMQEKMA